MNRIIAFLFVLFLLIKNYAQCSASNTYNSNYKQTGYITNITIYNSNYKIIFAKSNIPRSSVNTLLNTVPLEVFAGEKISIHINGTDSITNLTKVGIWFDKNLNDTFSANEYIGDSNNFIICNSKYYTSSTIIIPCLSINNTSVMRLRSISSNYNLPTSQGCGTLNYLGSILDIKFKIVNYPKPKLNLSDSIFSINQRFIVNISNYNSSFNYSFSGKNMNQIYTTENPFILEFTKTGYQQFKLSINSCTADSITKTVNIIAPTLKPSSNFFIPRLWPELNTDPVVIPDISSNNPTSWNWQVRSPSGLQYNTTKRDLSFGVDEAGTWKLCLTTSNSSGTGNKKCKYYNTNLIYIAYLGFSANTAKTNELLLYPNSGRSNNYGNNRKKNIDYINISPLDSGNSATIEFQLLDLKDSGDRLYIYAVTSTGNVPLHPSGGFTQNSKVPNKLFSANGKFFIEFESNASGTALGFSLHYLVGGKNTLTGNIYYDKDTNCSNTDNDIVLKNIKVKDLISGYTSHTNFNGDFYCKSDSQNMILKTFVPYGFKSACNKSNLDTINNYTELDYFLKGIVPDKTINATDLEATIRGNLSAGRGFYNTSYIDVNNFSNKNINNITVKINADRKLTNLFCSSNYTMIDSMNIKININSLTVLENNSIQFSHRIMPGDSGTVKYKISVYSDSTETDTINNTAFHQAQIVNAYDPNLITVSPSGIIETKNIVLNYAAQFQNTGSAPAKNVMVIDTLSQYLDTNSIKLTYSSYEPTYMLRKGRICYFYFENIQLIDSASDEPLSHAYFNFTAKPYQHIAVNTEIKNKINIYFDYEKPVATNSTYNKYTSFPELSKPVKPIDTLFMCKPYYTQLLGASDKIDGNITKNIQVKGSVKNNTAKNDTLIYSITNSAGNIATQKIIIVKIDNEKPHITLYGKNIKHNQIIKVLYNSNFVDEVSVNDNCRNGFITKFGNVDTRFLGMYSKYYYAWDSANNRAYEDSFRINYHVTDFDSIPPVINLNTPDSICVQVNTPYISVNPSVSDNISPNSEISIIKKGVVDPYTIGVYKEIYTATDRSGNTSTKTRIVYVGNCNATVKNIKLTFSIYPQPLSPGNDLYIKKLHSGLIKIYNLSGKMVVEKMIVDGKINIPKTILSGCYQLCITDKNGVEYFSKLLIK